MKAGRGPRLAAHLPFAVLASSGEARPGGHASALVSPRRGTARRRADGRVWTFKAGLDADDCAWQPRSFAAGHLRSNWLEAGPLGKDRESSVIEPLMAWRNSGSSRIANADLTLGPAPSWAMAPSSLLLLGSLRLARFRCERGSHRSRSCAAGSLRRAVAVGSEGTREIFTTCRRGGDRVPLTARATLTG